MASIALPKTLIPVIIATIMGALVGVALAGDQPAAEATTRLSLAERVDWPTHDAVRLEIVGWLQTDEFVASLGIPPHRFAATLPRNQAFIDLRSQAESDSAAVEALELAISHIEASEDTVSIEPYRDTVKSAQASLRSVQAELDEVNSQIDAEETSTLINRQGSLIWRAEQLEAEIDEAQRDLDKQVPRIFQISKIEVSDGQRLRRVRIVAAAALIAALAAAAVQTLRSSRQPVSPPLPSMPQGLLSSLVDSSEEE
ncbi:MAG: hypothetical protein V3V01_16810 [Acidimicrobiales bacterium]